MELNLNLKEEYKETELGLLPKDWEVVKLKNVVTTKKGRKPKTLSENIKKGYLPYLTADHFRTKRAKQFASTKNESLISVDKEDVVFIWDGSNAGDVFTGLNGVLASTMIKISPKKESLLTRKILYYYLKTKFYQFNTQTTGSTIPHVNKNLFENLLIPLPPLSEQKKIAYILSIVQEAKEKTEDVIKATKELKKSMMKYLFTYGPVSLEEVEKVPLKETEIGLIPEEWEVVRLGDLVKSKNIIIQFGFPCGKWNDKGLGVPHLRPFNVSNDGQVVLNGLKFINIERDINRYLLKKGDILFNNTNSEELVGKTAYWNKDGDFVLSNHMTIIRVLNFNLINSQFLANYLHKKWYDGFYLKICRRHVNQASISLARLEQIQIPLPPLSEQKKIASILSAIDQKIEAEENKKKSLEDLFKSLLHNLMTAKIRVNHLENVFDE